MKRLLREPLLHFLILGAAIFGVYAWLSGPAAPAPDTIVVTSGRIESLVTGFSRTWQRPPTQDELDGLIRDYVREEIAVREATRLGLEQDDTVIRRRLRQKLEFVTEDVGGRAEPTDAELQAWLDGHPDRFREEPRLSFRQVFLDPARRGEQLASDAQTLLAQLQRGEADASRLGDSLMLEPMFQGVPTSEVGKQFGDDFAAALDTLSVGSWQGPVASGYGLHLVLLEARTTERLPELAEAREAVLRDWQSRRRQESVETFYREVGKRYTVTIEAPRVAADPTATSSGGEARQ